MIKVNTKKNKGKLENNVSSARHKSYYNTESINRALERAIKDDKFVTNAIKLLNGIHFPVFKNNIVDYVRSITTTDTDMISLFESLDGYIKFKDAYHVQKALEENIPAKKKEYQITDKTREQPVVRTRNTTTADKSIKEREAVNKYEERKDYPEVTPTAMSDFICSMCGKSFQNQDDLVHHRQFERELREEGEIEEEGLKDREKGVNQQQQQQQHQLQEQPSIGKKQQQIERVGDITGEPPTNITTDKEIASKMANLLEGLEFPVTKEVIKDHINKKKRKSKVMKNNKIIVDTVLQAIQNNLQERIQYNNVYEIEKAAKLVRRMNG
jgi:hypothetical protein